MKKIKKFFAAGLVLLVAFGLAACTFEDYDDDGAIADYNGWSSALSAESTIGPLYIFTASKCNGVNQIRAITVPKNPQLRMTIDVESGRFKIVLMKDSTVYVIGSNEEDQELAADIPADTYQLCMVAQDAKVKLFQFWFPD